MTIDKVKEMIANQLNIGVEKVKPNSRLVEDLGADSLDNIEMLVALEDEFGISVPDDKVDDLKTVEDIANYIDQNAK
jgi:acyl carrier protein